MHWKARASTILPLQASECLPRHLQPSARRHLHSSSSWTPVIVLSHLPWLDIPTFSEHLSSQLSIVNLLPLALTACWKGCSIVLLLLWSQLSVSPAVLEACCSRCGARLLTCRRRLLTAANMPDNSTQNKNTSQVWCACGAGPPNAAHGLQCMHITAQLLAGKNSTFVTASAYSLHLASKLAGTCGMACGLLSALSSSPLLSLTLLLELLLSPLLLSLESEPLPELLLPPVFGCSSLPVDPGASSSSSSPDVLSSDLHDRAASGRSAAAVTRDGRHGSRCRENAS